MMRVRWIAKGTARLRGVGPVKEGAEFEVPDSTGKNLVARGLAEQVTAKPTSTTRTKSRKGGAGDGDQ